MVDFPPTEQVLQECLQVKHGNHNQTSSETSAPFCLFTLRATVSLSLAELNIEIKSSKDGEGLLFLQVLYNF